MKKTKKKYTLADLKPSATRQVELTHPYIPDLKLGFTIRSSQSLPYLDAYMARQEMSLEGKTTLDKLRISATIPASCVTAWDEELFGEYSYDNVLNVLSDVETNWIMFALLREIEDVGKFYPA